MGVESVQPPREPWTDIKTRCRRRQANARGRVGSFKVSPRAPHVLVSTSLSLWRGWSTSQRTNARTTSSRHGWLALQLQNLSATGKLAVQRLARWELLLFRNTAPLCLSLTPRARILSAEKHPFREMQDTCIDPQATDEPRGGFVFGLPCFVDGDSIKGRTQRRLRALHSVKGRGKERAFQPPHHGTPVEHGLANSCWQAGRSGRDGVMLQGAPVSRDLVGLSDRAGSDAATSDHQTEPTSTLHLDEPESTPPHAYYPPSCCQPFDRVGISKHMGAGPRCLLGCCVSGWLQDSVGIHKHISRSSSALTTWLRADRGGFQAPTPPVRQMKAI